MIQAHWARGGSAGQNVSKPTWRLWTSLQKALLLYQAGPETQEVFETLTDTGETAQEKLDAAKNVDHKIFQFWQAIQQSGESRSVCHEIAKDGHWVSWHQQRDKNCHHTKLPIRDSEGIHYANMPSLLMICWPRHAGNWNGEEPFPHRSKLNSPRKTNEATGSKIPTRSSMCGLAWSHKTSPCPAKGKTCQKCGKPNHFAKNVPHQV